jgi:dihydrofolate reductase
MQIRTRMAVSLDGFVATRDGLPAWLSMPDFVPGESYGYPEFIQQCDAVVMGRTTFEPAVGAERWPWPGKQVYVLSSRPLPEGTPGGVIASTDGPAELVEQLRATPMEGDVFLLGGPRTVQAFLALGAVDALELFVLPILLGDGLPLSPPGAARFALRLERRRAFPDGTVEHVYSLTSTGEAVGAVAGAGGAAES